MVGRREERKDKNRCGAPPYYLRFSLFSLSVTTKRGGGGGGGGGEEEEEERDKRDEGRLGSDEGKTKNETRLCNKVNSRHNLGMSSGCDDETLITHRNTPLHYKA